jgi:dTDP-4-dehydrorhamnose reductase
MNETPRKPTCPHCTGSLEPDWIIKTAASLAGRKKSEAKTRAARINATRPRPNRRKAAKTK